MDAWRSEIGTSGTTTTTTPGPRWRNASPWSANASASRWTTRRDTASAAGLGGIDVAIGDAAELDRYRPYVPADLVLICGLFGNVSDEDIRRTIGYAPSLTKRGGTVIWTRYRSDDDLFPTVADWFGQAGFDEVFTSDPSHRYGVGVHRSRVDPPPLQNLFNPFTFDGY